MWRKGFTAALALCLCYAWYATAQPIPPFYHKTEDILDYFSRAASKLPQLVRYETIPDPHSDANLPVVTVTNFTESQGSKEVILVTAGEHARELITSEIVYWVGALLSGQGEELADWAALQPVQAAAWKTGATKTTLHEWAGRLLQHVVFKFLPVVNVAGRKAAEAGETCQRRTVSGVDLNRNWEFGWKLTGPGDDEYGGEKPFSEPESRIVRLVAEGVHARSFVNLHAGEWAVYIPWDSQPSAAPGLPEDIEEVLEKLNMHCECMTGPAGKVAGYLAHGTAMDYMFNSLHVPYALTMEVYGPEGLGKLAKGGHPRRRLTQAAFNEQLAAEQDAGGVLQQAGTGADAVLVQEGTEGAGSREEVVETRAQKCLRDYNPLGLEDYQDVVARWLGALLVLAAHVAAHPVASSAAHDAGQSQQPLPPVKPNQQDLARLGQTAVEEHQRPEIFVRDARLVSETWGQGNASSLPQTSTNKSLPLHESEASLASDGQEAEYLTKVTHVADSLPSGLSIRRISMWGGCGVLVMGAVVLMYTLGRRLLQGRSGRMARRRSGMSSGRRHQRYSV